MNLAAYIGLNYVNTRAAIISTYLSGLAANILIGERVGFQAVPRILHVPIFLLLGAFHRLLWSVMELILLVCSANGD